MQQSIFAFISILLLTQRLIRFSKANNYQHWVKQFNYARYFAIFLFAADLIISDDFNTMWIWIIFLISFLVFTLRQTELRPLRTFIMAFVPYVAVIVISNLTKVINEDFYNRTESYFDTAILLSVIWFGALLYSQNRQFKAAEKERIQRQKEDEINRAIAERKVELEVLVAERTAELTKQKEELENTLEELRATQEQLIHSEKMASLGELTAGIAHEIQNPLNFVNNFSEVSHELLDEMQEELENENSAEAIEIAKNVKLNLEKIIHHGKRADSIVKGMLQHSRSSTGVMEEVEINVLCDEYLRLAYHGLRAMDKSFNATLKTDFDESIGKINVVPQEMGRVILNLLTNAFYAVNEKKKQSLDESGSGVQPYSPTVIISTKKHDNNIEIKISDNGNGIPKEAVDKIFQPFFTTKPSGKGTGLGLSLSYEIVTKAHGGKLSVENKPGEGVTFSIILPILKQI